MEQGLYHHPEAGLIGFGKAAYNTTVNGAEVAAEHIEDYLLPGSSALFATPEIPLMQIRGNQVYGEQAFQYASLGAAAASGLGALADLASLEGTAALAGMGRFGVFGDTAGLGAERIAASSSELEPGLYNLNPKEIRFSQPNVSPHFNNGTRVDDLTEQLKLGFVSPSDIPPIQVVQQDGKLFSLDNRRLLAFNAVGVDDVPAQVVSLDDPLVSDRFRFRFNPINGEGNYAVVVNRAGRNDALALLEEYGMINGGSYGY
jgi:hypothetical protein